MTGSPIELPDVPLRDRATAVRPWREADLDQLVEACQDAEIHRWTRAPSPFGEADGLAYLASRREGVLAGSHAPFAIVDAEAPGRLLGSIALLRFAWEHRRTEAGYWLAPWARGSGHALAALGLVCRWGFATLDLQRIELLIEPGNRASLAVAERSGFTREGILRSHSDSPSGRRDVVCWSLLPDEV